MSNANTFVSVVAPLENEAAYLEAFVAEVVAVLAARFQNFEVMLVDNGSVDTTPAVAGRLTREYPDVRLLRLARCLSPDVPAIAGLESAVGDVVVILRPGWDPPGEIPRVVQLAQEGCDIVQGIGGGGPPDGWVFRLFQGGFYFLGNRLLHLGMPPASSSLFGFTRRAVNAIVRIKQKQPHLGLLGCGVGFPRRTFEYRKVFRTRTPRRRGLLRTLDQGIGLLVARSTSPLRFISYLGGLAGLLNLLYVMYIIGVNCIKNKVAEGWTTLSLQNSLMFLFVFLILVLMAEYLGRLFEETKDRPLYHILDELGSSSVASHRALRNVLGQSPPDNHTSEREEHRVA